MGPQLSIDPHGALTVSLPDGRIWEGVTPVRCFPLADPDRYVSFVDARGREQWMLSDPTILDAASSELLRRELSRREFIPRIERVLSVKPASEPSTWEVETDRGPASFLLPSEDNLRRLSSDDMMLTDATGVRWRLQGIAGMDARSRQILRRYL